MEFEINRNDYRETRVVDTPPRLLQPGEVRLRIERFALTSNNISYVVAGDLLDYWGFFPTEAPWGRVPVMGLSTVAESAHPDIDVGGSYFGFSPIADDIVVQTEARATGFRDVGTHRSGHAAAYTTFRDVTADPMFQPDRADQYLLLWGLFTTSFLIDDSLADNEFYGAQHTLITSASSKTSIALAHCLSQRPQQRSVGLTSQRNRGFVERLGLYDEVAAYDEIDQLDPTTNSTLVDMAGNAAVRAGIHRHFGDHLTASLTVGATHWEHGGGAEGLPGPAPEFFFAPTQIAKRNDDWGPGALDARIAESFNLFVDGTDDWLTVEHHAGPDAIASVYHQLVDGNADPATGYIASMHANAFT